MSDPKPGDLDTVFHSPKRLIALSILDVAKEVEFKYLKERLGISDSDLSKQLSKLIDLNIIDMRKTGYGRKSSTWYAMTPEGKVLFKNYKETLKAILP